MFPIIFVHAISDNDASQTIKKNTVYSTSLNVHDSLSN